MNNAEDKVEINKINAMILNENTKKIAFYENVNSASKEMASRIQADPSLAAWLTLFVTAIDRASVAKMRGGSTKDSVALERLYAIAYMLIKTSGFNPLTTEVLFENKSELAPSIISFAQVMHDARKALDELPDSNVSTIIV